MKIIAIIQLMTIGATKYLSPIPPYRCDAKARTGAAIATRVTRCELDLRRNNDRRNSALTQITVGVTNPNHQKRPIPGHGVSTFTPPAPRLSPDEPTVITWIPKEISSPSAGSMNNFLSALLLLIKLIASGKNKMTVRGLVTPIRKMQEQDNFGDRIRCLLDTRISAKIRSGHLMFPTFANELSDAAGQSASASAERMLTNLEKPSRVKTTKTAKQITDQSTLTRVASTSA
jgi:hypothetical protein